VNKRLRFDTDEDDVTVPANPSDLAVELDNTKKFLNFAILTIKSYECGNI